MSNPHKQHANYSDYWGTPDDKVIAEIVRWGARVGLPPLVLDVAANEKNHKFNRYFSEKDNGLIQSWQCPGLWWCNPPFKLCREFIAKAHEELRLGNEGLMLIPNNAETAWFRESITYPNMPRMMWPHRIAFIDDRTGKPGTGNVKGSWIVAFLTPTNALKLVEPPWLVGQPFVGNITRPPKQLILRAENR